MVRARTAGAVAVLLALAGCTSAPDGAEAPEDPESPVASPTAEVPTPTATSSEPPAVAETPLAWRSTGGAPDERRIVGEEWTAVLDDAGAAVTVTGPARHVIEADAGQEIVRILMDDDVVVAVAADAAQPSGREERVAVTVLDLEDGDTHAVTDPQPARGAMSLHDGVLRYPTYADGAYCLAEADTDADAPAAAGRLTSYCAPKKSGFGAVTATDSGITLMAFDDARPVSCRTLGWLTDVGLEPLPGVTDCVGWDVAATPTGVVWSEVPRPRRQELAQFRASHDGTVLDLGGGSTGSLTPCGDSVFFSRDSRGDTPARLMRWTPEGTLQVAYEAARPTPSFLVEPECADDVLTLSVYSEGGDEQVWAAVG